MMCFQKEFLNLINIDNQIKKPIIHGELSKTIPIPYIIKHFKEMKDGEICFNDSCSYRCDR
jgi:hypothetical protein